MANKNNTKQKVWEMIADNMQSQGFKIGNTRKEAGLRTFQKWRNLERTYWRFKLQGVDEPTTTCSRRRKPFFYDALHDVLVKRNDYERKVDLVCKLNIFSIIYCT